MPTQNLGPLIVIIGVAVVGIGILVWSGGLSWFGRLPGDIRVERDGFRFYLPLTSTLVISVIISLLLKVFVRPR